MDIWVFESKTHPHLNKAGVGREEFIPGEGYRLPSSAAEYLAGVDNPPEDLVYVRATPGPDNDDATK